MQNRLTIPIYLWYTTGLGLLLGWIFKTERWLHSVIIANAILGLIYMEKECSALKHKGSVVLGVTMKMTRLHKDVFYIHVSH